MEESVGIDVLCELMPKTRPFFLICVELCTAHFLSLYYMFQIWDLKVFKWTVRQGWRARKINEKTSQHVNYTLLISTQCKWNTRPHGWNEHKRGRLIRGGDRGGGGCDITAASWVKAANSVVTWSHTEGAGRRSCKINTWRQCRRQTPRT